MEWSDIIYVITKLYVPVLILTGMSLTSGFIPHKHDTTGGKKYIRKAYKGS